MIFTSHSNEIQKKQGLKSKYVEVLHKKIADELVTIQHYLRLLASQLLLEMLFQLHQEIVTVQYQISATS